MKKLLTQSQNKFYLIIRKVDANSNGTESETYQISKTDKYFSVRGLWIHHINLQKMKS